MRTSGHYAGSYTRNNANPHPPTRRNKLAAASQRRLHSRTCKGAANLRAVFILPRDAETCAVLLANKRIGLRSILRAQPRGIPFDSFLEPNSEVAHEQRLVKQS